MIRHAALRTATSVAALCAAVALVGCDDKPNHPTAPRDPAPAVVAAPAPMAGVSTVCLAYMNKVSTAKDRLAKAEEENQSTRVREALARKAERLDAMQWDACR